MPSKTFTPNQKAAVALAALRGDKTIAQIASDFQVHPTQVGLWKKSMTRNASELFKNTKKRERRKEVEHQEQLDHLYKIIGQRDIELEWLKKKYEQFDSR